ncbi:MAG: hypothetical protein ABJQ71_12880 [Roseibium sp.]
MTETTRNVSLSNSVFDRPKVPSRIASSLQNDNQPVSSATSEFDFQEAFVVSISDEGREHLRKRNELVDLTSPKDVKVKVSQGLSSFEEVASLHHAEFQKMYAETAKNTQAMIAYIEAADPIPERLLVGDEKEAARNRFKNAEPVMTSLDGAKSFLEEETLYRFSANGDITIRHQLIPTSEEDKQQFLTDLKTLLEEATKITGGKSIEAIDRDIAALSQNEKNESDYRR